MPLPARRDGPLFGRELELERVRGWLEAGEGWLLSILGPPGVGKTRLARELAEEERDLGVRWVEVRTGAPLGDLARALGCEPGVEAIGRVLREGVDLLVLDDARATLDASLGPLVDDLASRLPHLRFLVATRSALGLPGEALVFLSGLGHADGPLSASAAGQLFHAACARAGGAPPSAADEPHVRAVLERIGQLPLAIELVAAQIADLGARAFAERLSRPLDWIVRGGENPLRLALDASAPSVSADARAFLVACAWLGRPFDLDDAGHLATDALPLLRALRTSSWLVASEDHRYDLLPPVRQYVLERLDTEGTMPLVARRALSHGLARGVPAPQDALEAALAPPWAPDAIPAPVLRAAVQRAFHVFAAAGAGERYASLAERLGEAGVVPRSFARLAEARGAIDAGLFDRAREALTDVDPSDEDEARVVTARLHFRTGNYDALYGLSMARTERAEDAEVLAVAARMRGDHELGLAIYARAMERAAPEERAILHALRARYWAEGGALDAALADCDEVLALNHDDVRLRASVAATRGLVALERDVRETAIAAFDESVRLYATLGSPLAAYVRCAGLLARVLSGRRAEAVATAIAVLDDAPPRMAQLQPFVALGRFLVAGAVPAAGPADGGVVAASHELVRLYAERASGRPDPAGLERACTANRSHERWSAISRALARLASTGPTMAPPAVAEGRVVLIGADASWFAPSGLPQTSLESRPTLARVLDAIARASERGAQTRASLDEIASAAWPGEKMLERAKRSRVHVAISTLRKLGLGADLSHEASGYRIAIPVVRAS